MAELKQVRIQVLDLATGQPIENVNPKTSDGAVYMPDGTTLRNYLALMETAQSEFQQKLTAHLASGHVNPDVINSLMIGAPDYEKATGTFVFKDYTGKTTRIDTSLEKVVTNWVVMTGKEAKQADATQSTLSDDKIYLVLTHDDDTKQYVDLSKLIDIYTGSEGDQIIVTVGDDGEIQASLAEGAVSMDELAEDVIEAINAVKYTLPAANKTTLGGVKVGNGLSALADGTMSTANIKLEKGEEDDETDADVALKFVNDAATNVTLEVSCDEDSVITVEAGTKVDNGISVSAKVTLPDDGEDDNVVTTYTWYKKTVGEDVAFTVVSGATSQTLDKDKIDTEEAGTTIYYCVVSASGTVDEEEEVEVVAEPVSSKRVTVVVTAAPDDEEEEEEEEEKGGAGDGQDESEQGNA